jgi:ABC-type multidrug transport system fused ATPase/permease subunit
VTPRRLVGDAIGLSRRYASAQRTAAILSIVGAISFAATIVVSAGVIGWITEEVVLPAFAAEGVTGVGIRETAAVLGGVAIWRSVSIVLRRGAAAWWQLRTEQALRRQVVQHQLGLSLRWYATRGVGDLLAVSGNDTKKATGLLAPLPFALGSLLLLVGAMGLVLTIDVRLGLIAGGVMIAVVAVDGIGSWAAFRNMQEVQAAVGRSAGVAHESFDGALTIRALGREAEEVERFRAASGRQRDALMRLGRSWTAFRTVTDLGPTLGSISLLAYATTLVARGAVGPSDLVTITYLLSLLVVPTRLIGYLVWDAAQSVAGWHRVRTVLDVTDRPSHGERTLPTGDGTPPGGRSPLLRIERASLRYPGGHPALIDIDLTLQAGRTYALVGATGSGKSSLTRLIAHLWEPDEGRVLLDGIDVRDLTKGTVASTVTYVSQEPFILDRSIRDNITLGDPTVSDADVTRAVRAARLEDVIDALPDGIATRVGERGTQLSGGQQQRLGLARALARGPRILVLDDATSALDAEIEAEILEGLRTSAPRTGQADLTVVLVASRPSSIRASDEVVHIESGRITATGTHETLLTASPGYAVLVEAYAPESARRAGPRERGP